MKSKMIKDIIFAASLCAFLCTQAFAANIPQVFVSNLPVNATNFHHLEDAKNTFIDQNSLNIIGQVFNAKMARLKTEGTLPFAYSIRDVQGINNDTAGKTAETNIDNNSVSIIPVILSDNCHEDNFVIGGKTFYRYQFRTEISILFCAYDGGALRIVYNVPLSGFATIGNSLENPILQPLSYEQKQEQYVNSTCQLINRYFKVPKNINKFLEQRKPTTYQVDKIDISSDAVNKKWSENAKENFIKPVIASNFTALYAETHPDLIVIPSNIGNPGWMQKVVQAISGKDDSSYNEEYQIGNVNISLELYKLAAFNIQKKNEDTSLYKDIGIAVGLKNTYDKKDILSTKQYRLPKGTPANLQISWVDIFGDAGKKLGSKK